MKTSCRWKRLLSLILAAAVCLSAVPWTVFAVEGEPASTWTKVDLSDVTSDDKIAITMTTSGGTTYALPNADATKGPSATVAAASGSTLTIASEGDDYAWTFTETDDGSGYYITSPSGSYLYLTNDNNGVRVGETQAVWTLDGSYLSTSDTGGNQRWLGVYETSPNWRAYQNTTGNTKDQEVGFWKLTEGSGSETTTVETPSAAYSEADGTVTFSCATEGVTYYYSVDGGEYTALDGNVLDVSGYAGGTVISYYAELDGVQSGKAELTITVSASAAGYVQVTDLAEITSGGQFVLVADVDGAHKALDTAIASKISAVDVTVSDNVVVGESLPVWTVENNGDGVNLYNGASYLGYSSKTNFASSDEAYLWTVTANEDGAFRFTESDSNTRAVGYGISQGKFGAYSTTNSSGYVLDLLVYKYAETSGGESGAQYAKLNNDIQDGDQLIVYYNKDSLVMGLETSGKGLAGVSAAPDGEYILVDEGMAVLTAEAQDDGSFRLVNGEGQYLTSGATGNSLTFEAEANDYSTWTVSPVTDGVHLVSVNAEYNGSKQALEIYNGVFTTFTEKTSDYYLFNLYTLTDETPEGGDTPEEPGGVATGSYVIWAPAYNMSLSSVYTGSYNTGVAVTEGEDGALTGYGSTEIWDVTANEDGTYTISYDGQNLSMGSSYSSTPLGEVNDQWTLEDAGDGLYYVKNVVRGQYLEWYAAYSDWSTYKTISAGSEGMFALKFTPAETEPGGEDEDGSYKPVDGDTVAIYYPAGGLVMTGTASGSRLTGAAATAAGNTLYTDGSELLLDVTVDENGYYTFTSDGKYLTTGSSGSSLTLADAASDYSLWELEEADGGWYIKNVNAKYGSSAQYIEYYSGFTTYSLYSGGAIYTMQFFKNVKSASVVDASLVYDIAQWGGGGPYDESNSSLIYGDKYEVGDMKDTGAVFTVVANGAAAQPYQQTSTSTGGYNYYMGGTSIGAAEGDYMQFAVSTAGWGAMSLSFRLRATNAAPGSFQVQYSTDGGKTFSNFTTGEYSYAYTAYTSSGTTDVTGSGTISDGVAKTSLAPTYYVSFRFDVPQGAENEKELLIRLVAGTEKANGASGTPSGNIRIDSVVLSGSPIVDDGITGYVAVTPDGVEEDQPAGTELTMTSATEGAVIRYRFVDPEGDGSEAWLTYDEADKPVLPELPAVLEVYAVSEGRADSVTRILHYAAGTVQAVKMTPNGGGVYIAGESVEVVLSTATEGAVIYYSTSTDNDGNDVYVEYDPENAPILLEKGFGTLTVKAYAVLEGFKDSAVTTRVFTERAQETYNIYFGQMHSHTSYSDGAGTAEDAYSHATGVENLDFLAVTDHSNSFDNADSASITDGSVSSEWVEGNALADKYTTDTFVGLFGYEMTWSNGLGHINTFNTDGFQSRTQSEYSTYSTALQNYYATLKTVADSISQFNHPGTTFGDFSDFAYYDEEIDDLITLIEVGNGEGTIGSSGYFPSYEYYTRALDKGWHVAPTNNQDNHKGLWGDANTARSVVLADSLTEEDIYDAMRNYRVYATEDNDLSIYYTLDGNIMGSILSENDVDDTVTLTAKLSDPTDSAIGKVEVIVNGGLSIASTTVSGNEDTVTFTVGADYSYYYIKVTEADGDIAVTAPVWVGEVEAVGISTFTTDAALAVQNQELNLTLDLYNNEKTDFLVESIVFTIDGETIHTADLTDLSKVGSMDTASYTFAYTHSGLGATNIYATVTGTLNGVEKVYQEVLQLNYVSAEMVTRVVVDGTHYNDYVTGYYGGNMGNFTSIAAGKSIEVTVVTDEITEETLADCALLVISAPARKAGTANAGDYTASTFEDSFIQLVANYVKGGGSVVICGLADYQDKSAVYGAEGHASAQMNKLLEAIGSTMRINDDEVYDPVSNGGQFYRLYPSVFNTESQWTAGVVEGQVYSQYSGCSVNVGEGTWLVRGFDTTYSVDSDKDGVGNTDEIETDDSYGYNIVTPAGEVVFLACEDSGFGGTIFAAGGVFLSDFEVDADVDDYALPYANRTIAENILDAVTVELPLSTIAQARQGEKGDVFRVQGYVTSGTANPDTTFFDCIYIQDETGGIDIFPYAEAGLELGTKIEIVGYVDAYQGDKELKVMSYKLLDEEPVVQDPTLLSCEAAMDYETNGGLLIQVAGTVKDGSIYYNSDGTLAQFVVVDENGGEATIFIDGYIRSGTTGENTLAETVVAGAQVTAVGVLYMHPEQFDTSISGTEVPVLRVRNCDEIVVTAAPDDPDDPVEPTDPPVDPTDPPVDPTDPPVEPTDPGTEPTDPGTEPTDPGTEPTDPGTEPTDPGADPTDPGTGSDVPPKTADALHVALWSMAALLAAAAVAAVVLLRKKQDHRSV